MIDASADWVEKPSKEQQYDENKQKHVTYGDGGCLYGTADSWALVGGAGLKSNKYILDKYIFNVDKCILNIFWNLGKYMWLT